VIRAASPPPPASSQRSRRPLWETYDTLDGETSEAIIRAGPGPYGYRFAPGCRNVVQRDDVLMKVRADPSSDQGAASGPIPPMVPDPALSLFPPGPRIS
jgi:hypothetical protein